MTDTNPEKYPEHVKMAAAKAASQPQGELLEWLDTFGYVIARWDDSAVSEHRLMPVHRTINEWLAEVHGIDLDVIEAEKRQMLAEWRAANTTQRAGG